MIDTYSLTAISNWNREKSLKSDDPKLQAFLTFESKTEYLAWRAEWKVAYAELSDRIRTLRTEWRAEGSDHDFQRHHALFSSRALARSMLALRAASKVKAGELRALATEAPVG